MIASKQNATSLLDPQQYLTQQRMRGSTYLAKVLLIARRFTLALLLIPWVLLAQAASVTGVYGSFGGGWASTTATASSTVQPNNSNLLLAFTVGGVTYSTGVNDGAIPSSMSFTPANFSAFAPDSITPGGSTLIGIANNWGGQPQDATGIIPGSTNSVTDFLTDGTQGLEMATALFNQPSGILRFPMGITSEASINDGIPDILTTQVGQPGAADTYRFVDANGVVVGNSVTVTFGNVARVGQQRWAFYDAIAPRNYRLALSAAPSRDLRLQAFQLSDFGITASNYANVAAFEQVLSGASDVAFVAYNRDVLAVQSTDVAVTIAATPTLVVPGATVSFTVTVTNTGYDASGVHIGVTLPPGFTFVSGSENPSVGSYDSSTGTWSIGALDDGGTVTLTLQATAGTQGGDATATLTGILNTDTNPDNNSDTAPVAVAQSTDVAVTITADPSTVIPNETVSFTVTVTNTGYDASGVQIGVTLPPGFTFVSGSENPSVGSYNSSTGTWSIGALADGGTVTLTLQATAGTQGGDATATLTGILNTDTNPDNNSDTAPVQVLISGQDPDQATAIPTLDEVALLILACALPLIAIRRFKPPHQNTAHKG